MSFLSYQELLEAIKRKEIRIAYYAVKDSQGNSIHLPEKQFVTLDPETGENDYAPIIREFFYESCKADSIYFHIGPYARVDITKRREQRKFVLRRDNSYFFDIKQANEIVVYSQESVVIGTDEYIEVSKDIGASIYATVRKTDVGFSHISTLIDPEWQGILQIGISNLSQYPQSLKYLERFCSVRFHRLNNTELDALLPHQTLRFRETRRHFGNDWWILENQHNLEILPRGSRYFTEPSLVEKILSKENLERAKQIFLTLVGGGTLLTLLFFIARLSNRLDDLSKIESSLDSNTLTIAELKKDLANLNKQFLQTGASEISISATRPIGNISIPFHEPLSSPPIIFVEFIGLPQNRINYSIAYPKINTGSTLKYSNAIISISYIGQLSDNQTLETVCKQELSIIFPCTSIVL